MIQNMPCKDAKGDTPATLKKILKTPDDSPKGYIVEADLEFPQHLHDKFKERPLWPESLTPKMECIRYFDGAQVVPLKPPSHYAHFVSLSWDGSRD